MDTSETYIKQCEEAEEIQKEWKPILGDWVCSAMQCLRNKKSNRNVRIVEYTEEKRGIIIIHSREACGTMDAKFINDVVYLPRQDQLQEILKDYWWRDGCDVPQTIYMKQCLDVFIRDHIYGKDESAYPNSWEQLWLAFVMKECYSKYWNGKDWISEYCTDCNGEAQVKLEDCPKYRNPVGDAEL